MTADEIDALAARWLARIDRAPLDPEEQRRLDCWLEEDGRHRGAFIRAQAVWQLLDRGRAIADPARAMAGEQRHIGLPTRRWLLTGAGAAASALMAGSFLRGPRTGRPPVRFATGARQIRSFALVDGSKTVVNAGSDLRLSFDDRRRLVSLEKGEGWFDVAKDRARPFVVQAGGIEARAVGTAFAVARTPSAIEVTVTEGIVEVSSPRNVIRVGAGGRARVSPTGEMMVSAPDAHVLDRDLAWRQRRIVLNGETLADVAARFNQFNDVRIVIADPQLAAEPVVGSFDLFAPGMFADAVASAFSVRVERRVGELVLSST